jgi:hypothetical protein
VTNTYPTYPAVCGTSNTAAAFAEKSPWYQSDVLMLDFVADVVALFGLRL